MNVLFIILKQLATAVMVKLTAYLLYWNYN